MVWMIVGGVLFIAAGSLAIHHHDNAASLVKSKRDVGLALGSIAIADGVVMLIDGAMLAKKEFKK